MRKYLCPPRHYAGCVIMIHFFWHLGQNDHLNQLKRNTKILAQNRGKSYAGFFSEPHSQQHLSSCLSKTCQAFHGCLFLSISCPVSSFSSRQHLISQIPWYNPPPFAMRHARTTTQISRRVIMGSKWTQHIGDDQRVDDMPKHMEGTAAQQYTW